MKLLRSLKSIMIILILFVSIIGLPKIGYSSDPQWLAPQDYHLSPSDKGRVNVVLTNNTEDFKNIKVKYWGAYPDSDAIQEVTIQPKSQSTVSYYTSPISSSSPSLIIKDLNTGKVIVDKKLWHYPKKSITEYITVP